MTIILEAVVTMHGAGVFGGPFVFFHYWVGFVNFTSDEAAAVPGFSERGSARRRPIFEYIVVRIRGTFFVP